MILLAGLAGSLSAWWYVQAQVRDDARDAFLQQAHEIHRAIAGRLDGYQELLWGLRGLFHVPRPVTRRKFRDYVDSLALDRRNPAVTTVNYGEYVPAAELARFERQVRADRSVDPAGYPAFRVFPRREPRPAHEVLVYLEPFAPLRNSFGLDMAQRPSARFEELRRSGGFLSSGELVDHQPGLPLALRLAVYRRSGDGLDTPDQREAAYIGSVGMGFSLLKLMEEAVPAELLATMRIRIRNRGRSADLDALKPRGEGSLLIDTAAAFSPAARATAQDKLLQTSTTLDFGGALLELSFESPLRLYQPAAGRMLAPAVLATGLALSVLLALFVSIRLRTQRRLARAVALRSAELAAANAALEREIGERNHLEADVMRSLLEERRRYSQELHDNLGQHLIAAGFLVEVLRGDLHARRDAAESEVIDIAAALAEVITHTRMLSHRLNPVQAGEGALDHALQELAADVNAAAGLRCSVHIAPARTGTAPVDGVLQHHLFRMVKQLVGGASGRGAKRITISLTHAPLALAYEDDGAPVEQREDMVLRIIAFRCRVLGLALDLPPAGSGTPAVRGLQVRIAATGPALAAASA